MLKEVENMDVRYHMCDLFQDTPIIIRYPKIYVYYFLNISYNLLTVYFMEFEKNILYKVDFKNKKEYIKYRTYVL